MTGIDSIMSRHNESISFAGGEIKQTKKGSHRSLPSLDGYGCELAFGLGLTC